jgi:hypothetical protein
MLKTAAGTERVKCSAAPIRGVERIGGFGGKSACWRRAGVRGHPEATGDAEARGRRDAGRRDAAARWRSDGVRPR